MEIREIKKEEMKDAIELVWETFLKYEAPDYSQEGIDEFERCIRDKSWIEAREFYGAFEDEKIVGVVATKDKHHIALLFVDGNYHRRGIGRKLYEKVESLNPDGYFTVNSSPYAKEVYVRLGFEYIDEMQEICGIKFYPMRKEIK